MFSVWICQYINQDSTSKCQHQWSLNFCRIPMCHVRCCFASHLTFLTATQISWSCWTTASVFLLGRSFIALFIWLMCSSCSHKWSYLAECSNQEDSLIVGRILCISSSTSISFTHHSVAAQLHTCLSYSVYTCLENSRTCFWSLYLNTALWACFRADYFGWGSRSSCFSTLILPYLVLAIVAVFALLHAVMNVAERCSVASTCRPSPVLTL